MHVWQNHKPGKVTETPEGKSVETIPDGVIIVKGDSSVQLTVAEQAKLKDILDSCDTLNDAKA